MIIFTSYDLKPAIEKLERVKKPQLLPLTLTLSSLQFGKKFTTSKKMMLSETDLKRAS